MYKPEQIKNFYQLNIKNKSSNFYISSSRKILIKKFITTLSAILFILSIFLPARAEEVNSGYAKNEILFVKWGDGENEIGLHEEEKEKPNMKKTKYIDRKGPVGFDVDNDGNIYLGDSKNNGIIKYKHNEKNLNKIKLQKGKVGTLDVRFHIDKESRALYILDKKDNTLDVIDSDNKKERKTTTSELISALEKPSVVIKDGAVIDRKDKRKLFDFNIKSTQESENSTIDLLSIQYNRISTIDIKNKMVNMEELNSKCNEVIIKTDYQFALGKPLGIDIDNNLYYWCDKIPEVEQKFKEFIVLKLIPSECRTELIEMEKDISDYPSSQITIDNNGNIYQMLPKEDGVHIIKWSK